MCDIQINELCRELRQWVHLANAYLFNHWYIQHVRYEWFHMKIVIIGRNFPLGGHKDDFYHSSSKSVNGLVYCLLQIYGRAVWKLFSRFPFSSFAFLKLILYFFQLEKSLDGFSRTWIMIKQSIRVLKFVNSLRGGWLSYKCITLFIPDSGFWQDSISQGFILCNFITWKM